MERTTTANPYFASKKKLYDIYKMQVVTETLQLMLEV